MKQHVLVFTAEDIRDALANGANGAWERLAQLKSSVNGEPILVRVDFPDATGGCEVRVRRLSPLGRLLWACLRWPVKLWEG